MYSQSIDYNIQLSLDSTGRILTAHTHIKIPSSILEQQDTVWFRWKANAYAQPATPLAMSQLQQGKSEFYFRKTNDFAQISDIVVSDDKGKLDHFFLDEFDEILGVRVKKSTDIYISYTLRLPKYIDGWGYTNEKTVVKYFYPTLTFAQGQWHNQPFISEYSDDLEPSNMSISISSDSKNQIYAPYERINQKDTIHLVAKNSKNVAILFTSQDLANISGVIETPNQKIEYQYLSNSKNQISHSTLNEMLSEKLRLIFTLFPSYTPKNLFLLGMEDEEENFNGDTWIPVIESHKDGEINELKLVKNILENFTNTHISYTQDEKYWLQQGFVDYYTQKLSEEKSKKHLSNNYYGAIQELKGKLKTNINTTKKPLHINDLFTDKYFGQIFYHFLETRYGYEKLHSVVSNIIENGKIFSAQSIVSSFDETEVIPLIEDILLYIDTESKMDGIKWNWLWKSPEHTKKNLFLAPFPIYNDNDGLMPAFFFTNSKSHNKNGFSYHVLPAYSIINKKLLGEAALSYRYDVSHPFFSSFTFGTSLRSFDFNSNTTLDYSTRYIRLDPTVIMHKRHKNPDIKQSHFALKSFFIAEEVPVFTDGKYTGIQTQNSSIFRIEYLYKKQQVLKSSSFRSNMEYQSYGEESYLKMTGMIEQRYLYKPDKNLYFRLFAAGFLQNTQRKSRSFQNAFTKGSIALIHQGFNDYTYEEYYLSRQNQNKLQDNQISMTEGGGFKTPVGSAYNIGMSNHMALAFNFSADIPMQTPKWMPIRIYFDIGNSRVYSSNTFVNNTMYNAGFSIHFKEILSVYLPLLYSSELGNIYKGVHDSFFSRVSFGLNLHQTKLKHSGF